MNNHEIYSVGGPLKKNRNGLVEESDSNFVMLKYNEFELIPRQRNNDVTKKLSFPP
jgi:hypothetical protein